MGIFRRISSLLQVSFAKETYNLIDPTNQSHPIGTFCVRLGLFCVVISLVCAVGLVCVQRRSICVQIGLFVCACRSLLWGYVSCVREYASMGPHGLLCLLTFRFCAALRE